MPEAARLAARNEKSPDLQGLDGDAKINIQAEVHEEPDGTFWAKVTEPESLSGVFATGDTFDELFELTT